MAAASLPDWVADGRGWCRRGRSQPRSPARSLRRPRGRAALLGRGHAGEPDQEHVRVPGPGEDPSRQGGEAAPALSCAGPARWRSVVSAGRQLRAGLPMPAVTPPGLSPAPWAPLSPRPQGPPARPLYYIQGGPKYSLAARDWPKVTQQAG